MANPAEAIRTLEYRAQQNHEDIVALDRDKADKEAVDRIADDVAGLRKLLIGFLVSFAIGALTFGLAVLAELGMHLGS